MTLCSFLLSASAVIIASGLLFAKYMGFFKKIVVRDITFAPSYLIYTKYQGSYRKLMNIFAAIEQDLGKFCGVGDASSSLAASPEQLKTFGIYYDDPKRIIDDSLCRAILGAIIPMSMKGVSEENLVELLKKINRNSTYEYCLAKFSKPLIGFGTVFPYLNSLSITYAVTRGYPKIKKYGAANNLLSGLEFSFEIYDTCEKTMTIAFPYKGDLKSLLLSGAENPNITNTHPPAQHAN